MLPIVERLLAASFASVLLAGCSGVSQFSPEGNSALAPSARVQAVAASQRGALAQDLDFACRPLEAPLRGSGGLYAFRSGTLTVTLGYARNTLGIGAVRRGYIRSCNQPLGGNTPGVPNGYVLDWEGIVAPDANVEVTFGPARRLMQFSGPALNPHTRYTLFVFGADSQLSWEAGATVPLGFPVKHVLATPSLLQNGYSLTGTGLFFILAH